MKITDYSITLALILGFLFFSGRSFSQSRSLRESNLELPSKRDKQQTESKKVRREKAKAERAKEREWNTYSKAKARDMKHRMDLQSPETRKRMKEDRKKAEMNNNHYHRSFWHRVFG